MLHAFHRWLYFLVWTLEGEKVQAMGIPADVVDPVFLFYMMPTVLE